MAITPRTAAASSGANTTSCTVTIPSAVQADDILILDVVNRDSTANVSVTDNDTGGNAWTRVLTQNANTNGSGQLWWKRATSATASKTITVSGATGSVACVVTPYAGASLASNPLGTPVGEANASADESQAGITTTRDGSWVHHAVACTSNDTLNPGNRTATDPSSLTESGEGTSTGGSDCSVSAASAERATAGSTGTISWSQTNGTGASYAVELLPAWAPLTASSGNVPITGTAASLEYNRTVIADAANVPITGTAATVGRKLPLSAAAGTVPITGTDATLTYEQVAILQADAGSVPITGTAAVVGRRLTLGAAGGALAVTGTDASTKAHHLISAQTGSVPVAGTDAGTRVNHRVDAQPGSVPISGTAASLKETHLVAAQAGAVPIVGAAATLTYVPGSGVFTLVAAGGAVPIGGSVAQLNYMVGEIPESGLASRVGLDRWPRPFWWRHSRPRRR